ncbi:Tn7-like element transposition protein TnsE [Acinetobacter baumannii]|uniref:Tn7-like element transposition protein TnsE n=1 Tax=Acinetobacter baumannii TaxID=470 RepID=UPI002966360C|nr:Tn7-like element transposition protein TnsE [Acinetobacter baumannii]MDW3026376.1 Tn7-like element transposition protein TnsE [Acinetobacter baumannii]
MIKIRNFPENARITFLSSIFKDHKNSEWNIHIGLENHYNHLPDYERYMVKYARFSNMPLLAKNRRFNQTKEIPPYNESIITIKIDDFKNWQITTSKSGQYLFRHIANDLKGAHKNIKINLPHIELARVLFFHNAYLSRAALTQGKLTAEYYIVPEEQQTTIHVHEFCGFPSYQYDNVGMRRLLSWILLDTEARASYESISKHFLSEQFRTKTQTFWNFNFTPPSLGGAEITMKVYFSEKNKQYYVNEIIGIANLPTDISNEVIFCSPNFTVKNSYEKTGGSSGGRTSANDDPTIDEEKEADSDQKITKIESPKITMSLAKPYGTKKATLKRSGKKGIPNQNDVEILPDHGVGTGEATIFGEIGRGEFENVQDESDDLEFFMKRFEAFKVMVEQFASQHRIQPIIHVHKLPAVNRSKLHRTHDGNPRCIIEVQLSFQGKKFVILEIDTSDNLKPLSTLIIKISDTDTWNSHFPTFRQQVVKRSLRWPTAKSLQNIGIRKTFNHPRNLTEMAESDEEFKNWGRRLEDALLSLS